jgi:RNA polymerase sigma factor (sigma-70 family)
VAGDDGRVEFCEREFPHLVGAVALYCGDVAVAEEIAQEALARACRYWPRVSQYDAPGAWARRVALNLASSHLRRRALERRARARLAARTPDAYEGSDVADAVTVRRAVSSLPPRQRLALVLRYYADLSVADTAAQMRCAEGTVKALTAQGIAALRATLNDSLIEEPADVS